MRGPLWPSPWIQHQFFSIIYQKIITFHPAELFFNFFLVLVIFGQNRLECDSMWNYRRLTRNRYLAHTIPQKTWFQAILAQKKNGKKNHKKKNKKQKKRENRRVRRFYGVRRSCRVRGFYQYVYVPSCGVRCPRWSAKNLWNAKNSEYAWLV